jgi:mono/diheme cytochrome c family protein
MKLSDYVSPEELKRLLAGLVVFLGVASIFGLFGFTVVPGLRNANKPQASPSVEPAVGEWGWFDPREQKPREGYEVPPVDPKTILEPDDELLEEGKKLYAKNCEQCHGAEGRGDGPAAGSLASPPRDFTSSEGWKRGYGRHQIFEVLANGIEGSPMAAFEYLSPKKRMALVHHVRSLITFSREPEDPVAIEALSGQLARAGETIPNKIPVSVAIARLEEEFKGAVALDLPPATDASAGAEALRQAVLDPSRAVLTLTQSPSWREGAEQLAQIVVNGAPSNGFSIRTATFTVSEWKALRKALITRMGS